MSKLNSKTLTIAAALLMVLALLYVATPLLRPAMGFSGRQTLTGQGGSIQVITPGDQAGGMQVTGPGAGQNDQGFIIQGSGSDAQGQGSSTRQFSGARPGGILGFGLMNGNTGIIVYAIALLVSLAAAVGMLMTKNWGRVLGIIMGVVYFVLALFGLVPTLLMGLAFRGSAMRVGGSLSIWLAVAHLVLAIAVIVIASVSARKAPQSAAVVSPPA